MGKDGHDHGKLTVVFKVELHCEGCAKKIVKAAETCGGVESAVPDNDKSKLTVVGDVDPVKLRKKLEKKTKKKIVLVSPQPKPKEDQTSEKKPDTKKKPDENKSNEKKAPVSTTVVLKMRLHCDGCIKKIRNIIRKTKGVEQISFDEPKDLITVKVTMDVKDMLKDLEKRMKRTVEIVPAKKSEGKDDGKAPVADGGRQPEYNQWPMQMPPPMGWYGPGYLYNVGPAYPSYPVYNVQAPQTFSDENPSACSVM